MDFSPLERLDIISNSLQRAQVFVESMDIEAFRGDRRTRYAVIFSLETAANVAGEARPDVRGQLPDVPWAEFDKIKETVAVARYHETNPDDIWKMVTVTLPGLLRAVQHAVALLQLDETKRPNVN